MIEWVHYTLLLRGAAMAIPACGEAGDLTSAWPANVTCVECKERIPADFDPYNPSPPTRRRRPQRTQNET